MEKVFNGKVFEILPTTNGIIFSYLSGEMEDGKTEVSYKMISFDNRRITDVAKNIYMITKFGNGYKGVERLCENYITAKSLILPGGKVFLLLEDGTAHLIDPEGDALWTGSLVYRGIVPSDIILFGEGLWACYPEGNLILKYSLTNMKQELRVGGKTSPFDGPCDLFEEDNTLIICNKKSAKIQRLSIKNYDVLEYETFEEPLLQYVNVNGYRFVILESGLYVI
ncbi:MAG: hypothetical protein IJO62_05860 [Clostridia bacterium]|nr:hypothetical protein [Clostridia bacterium]